MKPNPLEDSETLDNKQEPEISRLEALHYTWP